MAMDEHQKRLAHSWQSNAEGWTRTVREGRIESRRLVTDAAIVAAAQALHPKRALDIGCGEGWLCRALAGPGVEVVGVDACAALIASAQAMGAAQYHVCRHADLAGAGLGKFDLLLCNFALLDEHLQVPLQSWRDLLLPQGRLLIQTVHPHSASEVYEDGWRLERFDGFGEGFPEPMPWYFRTLESWLALLVDAGWRVEHLQAPPNPLTGKPVSLLLQAIPAVEGPSAQRAP